MRKLLLISCIILLVGCNKVSLYDELSEQQANEVLAALLAYDIKVDKTRSEGASGWTVSVEEEDFPFAMKILKQQQLPSKSYEDLGQVFEKTGFVSSPLEEKARYIYGVSQELSQTLSQLSGVLSARVHIALPEQDVFGEEVKPSSASVVIIVDPTADIVARETDIKAIVKDGVEGMNDVNKVTVKFFRQAPIAKRPINKASEDVQQASTTGLPDDLLSQVFAIVGALLLLMAAVAVWNWSRRT